MAPGERPKSWFILLRLVGGISRMGCLAPHYRVDGANSHTGHNFKDSFFSKRDFRWLFVPAFAMILGWIDPLWSSPMQWDRDHLQTARYLGRWMGAIPSGYGLLVPT